MANPQVEDGHLDLANDIVDRLMRLHLPGNEWQCLWVVLRKTWGWRKKWDAIPLSQFVELTGLGRNRVCEALQKLIKKNILLVRKTGLLTSPENRTTPYTSPENRTTYVTSYCFNKDFDSWVLCSPENRTTPYTSPENRNGVVRKTGHSKTTIQKPIRTLSKERVESQCSEPELFPSKPESKPDRKPKAKIKKPSPETDPRIHSCKLWWVDKFKETQGIDYPCLPKQWSRHVLAIKDILDGASEDDFKMVAERWLNGGTGDNFLDGIQRTLPKLRDFWPDLCQAAKVKKSKKLKGGYDVEAHLARLEREEIERENQEKSNLSSAD